MNIAKAIMGILVFGILIVPGISCHPNSSQADSTDSDSTDTNTDTLPPKLQTCEGTVVIEDPYIEERLRFWLGRDMGLSGPDVYTGTLTGEVLQQLRTRLIAGQGEVPDGQLAHSLYGLECATNLEILSVEGNDISDLAPLSRMTKLRHLVLRQNSIQDISPLAALPQLEKLDLSYNPITDVSVVASLVWLNELRVEGLGLKTLDMINNMPLLEDLFANDNELSELTPLVNTPALMTLEVSRNSLHSLEPLSGLPRLGILAISENSISDLSPLAGLDGLAVLDMSHNQIVDLTPIAASAPGLYQLSLHGNAIEDISLLVNMPMLGILTLNDNAIVDVSPLVECPSLDTLLKSQAFLDLSHNRIHDLEPLRPVAGRVNLHLEHNEIENLGVALDVGATHLAWNKIQDLGPLAGAKVGQLNLAGNPISSLAPVLLAASNGWSPEWLVVSATPLDDVALGYEAPALCELGMNLFYGQDERCLGSTLENPYPVGDAETPSPSTTIEPGAFCPLEPAFLASHGLPSDDREAADYVVEEPVANEPIVVDSLTGLVWRRCAVGQSWNGATCQGTATSLSLSEALDACADSFGNVARWRLPHIAELQTLVDRGVAHPLPCVEGSVFPGTHPGRHWSKTEVAGSGARASWAVNFYNGTTTIASSMVPSDGGSTAVVRCVSAESSAPSGSRFDTTGSIVHDAWTSLEWQRCPVNATWDGETCGQAEPWFSWAEAFDACLVLGEGWRLPAASELLSLVDYCRREPAMGEPFAGSLEDGSNRGPHWSATQYLTTDAERSVAVDFSTGQTLVSRAKDTLLARCVRSTNE